GVISSPFSGVPSRTRIGGPPRRYPATSPEVSRRLGMLGSTRGTMSSTTIVRWDGDLRVASEVLTRGFAGYGVPQRETPEAVQRQVEAGYIAPARSFLALDSGIAIGGAFAAARPDGCARLHALVVDPGWRRRGLGRALLRAARNDLEAAGSWEVGTET